MARCQARWVGAREEMKLEKLIEVLSKKRESNNTEHCYWCDSSDVGVDKNGERSDDPDEIVEYHFLDCADDCMERLIPAILTVLRSMNQSAEAGKK